MEVSYWSTHGGRGKRRSAHRHHAAPKRPRRTGISIACSDSPSGTSGAGRGLTIAQIAERTQLSRGMLSKIETGHAAMSLESLSRIAAALGVSLASLFRGVEARGGGAQHIKAGTGMEVVRRGTKRGHTYHLLAYDQGPHKRFEPFLICRSQYLI